MNKNYIKKLLITGLSITSLSLPAMLPNSDNPQVQRSAIRITFTPIGSCWNITPENRDNFTNYFKKFKIELDPKETHIVNVLVQKREQWNKKNKRYTSIADALQILEIPSLMPITVFTNEKSATASFLINDNMQCIFSRKQMKWFSPHNYLLQLENSKSGATAHTLGIAKTAKEFQKKLADNEMPDLSFLIQQQENKTIIPETKSNNIPSQQAIISEIMEPKKESAVEQVVRTKNIPAKLAQLCQTIKDMLKDCDDKNSTSILFAIPENIKEETLDKILHMLDLCLLLNVTSLTKSKIENAKMGLVNDIDKICLQDLSDILIAADYLNIVEEHKKKPIPLLSILKSTLLSKLSNECYENRKPTIDSLASDLQKALLDVFLKEKQLREKLIQSYMQLESQNTTDSYTNQLETFAPSLEQALLIWDIIEKKESVKNLEITDNLVTKEVKLFLDFYNTLQFMITGQKEAQERYKGIQFFSSTRHNPMALTATYALLIICFLLILRTKK